MIWLYLISCAIAFPLIARSIYIAFGEHEEPDKWFSMFFAAIICWVWPLVLIALLVKAIVLDTLDERPSQKKTNWWRK